MMLVGEKVKKKISGRDIPGVLKAQLSEIGSVGISSHLPYFVVELYIELEDGTKDIDILSWGRA